MVFHQKFLNALNSNTTGLKTFSIQSYLPISISLPKEAIECLPYLYAFKNIVATYPYYYEILELDSYCLLYTEKGSGTLTFSDRSYTLLSNTLCFIDCHELHRIELQSSPWNYKVFFIGGSHVNTLYDQFINLYGNLHTPLLGSSIPATIQTFYNQLENNMDKHFLHSKFLMNILMDMLIEKDSLERSPTPIPSYLEIIKRTFDLEYNKPFSLDDLEREYHISKYRICREFSAIFNLSPIHYLNNKRIEVAKIALVSTDKRINEIGTMVGIDNTNHFIRLFKKYTGVTPLIYRKQAPAYYFTS